MPDLNSLLTKAFTFQSYPVRIIGTPEMPWWVAQDVCKVFGLNDVSKACDVLDDDEKTTARIQTLGGSQEMLIISEPGLYSLIFKSRKPVAKQFQRWVFHEVLPAIRKSGSYSAQPETTIIAAPAAPAIDSVLMALETLKSLTPKESDIKCIERIVLEAVQHHPTREACIYCQWRKSLTV